jgi:hypothetical protein
MHSDVFCAIVQQNKSYYLLFSRFVGTAFITNSNRIPMSYLNYFQLPDSSSRTVASGLTKPLAEKSTRNYSRG